MFYIQLNSENIITDVISYEHEGYIPVSIPAPLPDGIGCSWYKWTGNGAVLVPELKQASLDAQIQTAIDAYTLEMIEGGLL